MCIVCQSFSDEQKNKIKNRKRYHRKDKADTSREEFELFCDPEAGEPMFLGSQQELKSSAQAFY